MKGCTTWSYAPYRPFLWEVGDIYICRIVPSVNSIHIEWLEGEKDFEIFYRVCGEEEFTSCGKTDKNEFDITGLKEGND